jgi:hypothetical protein
VAEQIGFADSTLYDSYRQRWLAVRDAKDDLKKLEVIGHWLGLYGSYEGICSRILSFMVHFLHQVFRKDFFRSIQELVRAEKVEEALSGRVMLCWDSLAEVLRAEEDVAEEGEAPTQLKGLWLQYTDRTKVRTLQDIVDLLWDIDDGQERGRWEKYTYRILYKRARELVRLHVGRSYEVKVHEFSKRQFVLLHWILPFPNTQRFWRTQYKRKAFIAVQHSFSSYGWPRQHGDSISWEQIQELTVQYSAQESSSKGAWMHGWHLASALARPEQQRALVGVPYEAVEVADDLYSSWEGIELELAEEAEAVMQE